MSEWVSVDERLPSSGAVVIGSGFNYGKPENGRWVEPTVFEDHGFHSAMYDLDSGDLVADFDTEMTPTHWMPLPEPPK